MSASTPRNLIAARSYALSLVGREKQTERDYNLAASPAAIGGELGMGVSEESQ